MSRKRIIVMLTILLITILGASSFYVIEKGINPLSIVVNKSSGETSGDYIKVYEKDAPYDDGDGRKYYIKYTGAESGRTVVDLEDEHVMKEGKDIGGCGLTIGEDKYPYIFNQKIESTYKMFSDNETITQVFVPSVIAFPNEDGENKGIAGNTFESCDTTDRDIDLIYHTPDLIKGLTASANTANGYYITSDYNKTSKIQQDGVNVYVYLGKENILRNSRYSGDSSSYYYRGKVTNVYLSNEVDYPYYMFYYRSGSQSLTHALLDTRTEVTEDSKKNLVRLFSDQGRLTVSKNFQLPEGITSLYYTFAFCSSLNSLPTEFIIPDTVTDMRYTFTNCYSLETLPEVLTIPKSVTTLYYTFYNCQKLKGIVDIQCEDNVLTDMSGMFFSAGTSASNNYESYPTPIIMLYHTTCSKANSYTDNVYRETAKSNKVFKVALDSTLWEKVYGDNSAPYKDSKGQYYIRYIGESNKIDLSTGDGGLYQSPNGYPYVLGTKLTNTYKMFHENDKVEKVFVSKSIAVKENGIKENTFDSGNEEKSIIYYTDDLSVDKTTISTSNNVKIYIYLDNNILPRTEDNQTVYTGTAKNVYISESVNYPSHLFDHDKGVTLLNRIYIEDDAISNWGKNELSMDYMFNGQSNITNVENMYIPANLTSMKYMFAGCKNLKKLSGGVIIPITITGDGLSHTFENCENLTGWSENIKISNSVTNLEKTFYNCKYLKTCLKIYGKYIVEKGMNGCLEGAGYSASNYDNYKTPIVLKYLESTSNAVKNYNENIYDEKNSPGNKVTKELVLLWTKEYGDEKAPYDDGDGKKYYIHYNGVAETLELDKTDEENEIEYDSSTGYPTILGVKITSTYKMFSNNDDIKMVFVPYGTAYTSDPNSDETMGIASNTFEGCNTKNRDIDIIYHTPNFINGQSAWETTANGSYITSTYDRTGKITQTGVITYVYLGKENILRTSKYSGSQSSYYYKGVVANVYLSNEVDYPNYMFYYDSSYSKVRLTHALLDTRAEVTQDSKKELRNLFYRQSQLTVSKNFRLPEGITSIYGMFSDCSSLTNLPDGFTIPDTVTVMDSTFNFCTSLKEFPDSFKIPEKIESLTDAFIYCSALETFPKGKLIIPENARLLGNAFAYCKRLKGIIIIKDSVNRIQYSNSTFNNTSISAGSNALTVYVQKGSQLDTYFYSSNSLTYGMKANSTYVTRKYLEDLLDNYSVNTVSETPINIDNMNIYNDTNQDTSSDKVIIGDETEWVTITVNKKSVDEVVDDTQVNSQSVENVEENKSEDEKTQE